MAKELAVKETTEVALNNSDWGDVEVSSRDLVISRITLMQGLSELVSDGKAKLGDLVNSVTKEVIASKDTTVELLPFYCTKTWITSKKKGNKFEFESAKPDQGQVMPFEETIGGEVYKHEHCYQFFFMTKELSIPVVASFRGMSHKVGKQLFTLMYVNNKQAGLPPANNWVSLGSVIDKNDKGTFAVMSVKLSTKAVNDELKECLKWISTFKTSGAKVDEAVEAAGTDAPQTARF